MPETLLRRPILIGERGDGYSNMQCLQALYEQGFTCLWGLGESAAVKVTLLKGGEPKKFAEGNSHSVALRRLFAGETKKALAGDTRFTEDRHRG